MARTIQLHVLYRHGSPCKVVRDCSVEVVQELKQYIADNPAYSLEHIEGSINDGNDAVLWTDDVPVTLTGDDLWST